MTPAFRVLSYNIHKGFSTTNQNFVLDLMREAVRKTSADLVFLQEVLGHHSDPDHKIENWPTTAQFEFLADSFWSHYAYGKNAIYTEGHHGNAILSKFPIVAFDNIDISNNRLQKRGLLHAIIEIPNGRTDRVHAICVHLDLMEGGRRSQIEKVCAWIGKNIPAEEPLIIAGDFNDWLQRATDRLESSLKLHEVFQVLDGSHAKTFPSFWPSLALDRIYFRNLEAFAAIRMRGTPWHRLSDHVPLYAEFKF